MIKWLDHHDSIKLNHSLEDVVHRLNTSISEQVNKKGIDRLFRTHGWRGSVSAQGGVIENGWSGNVDYSRFPSMHASIRLNFEANENETIIHFRAERSDNGIGPLIIVGLFLALTLAILLSAWFNKGIFAWPGVLAIAGMLLYLRIYRLWMRGHVENCMSFIQRLMKEKPTI